MSAVTPLSKREQQIMDVVYARGQATAIDVWQALANPPSRSAIRTLIGILEQKGHLRHKKVGREFVYQATRPKAKAGRSALNRVIDVFFGRSVASALAAHLSEKGRLPDEELERLSQVIQHAKQRGR